MEIIIKPDAASACALAAKYIAKRVRETPTIVLGLATGGTPLNLYRELVRLRSEEGLDFSGVNTFNLDEYVGLAPEHPASFHRFMRDNLFDHLNIPDYQIHIPDGLAADVPEVCREYEHAIRDSDGIDLQLLGIGADGHIGFNEPSSSLASRTRIKTLTEETITDNSRFFDSQQDVPRHAITMGIGTILESRTCMLLAFGEEKADALAQAVEGPVTASCTI